MDLDEKRIGRQTAIPRSVYQDDVEYVQDYAKHDSPFLPHRDSPDGSDERSRSEAEVFGQWQQSERVQRELAMVVYEKQTLEPHTPLEIVWRNQSASVRADLRARQQNNPYCRWAEQAGKIRARRSNWDANRVWVA